MKWERGKALLESFYYLILIIHNTITTIVKGKQDWRRSNKETSQLAQGCRWKRFVRRGSICILHGNEILVARRLDSLAQTYSRLFSARCEQVSLRLEVPNTFSPLDEYVCLALDKVKCYKYRAL